MAIAVTNHDYLMALTAQAEAELSITVAMPLDDAYAVIRQQQHALEQTKAVIAMARMYPQILVEEDAAEQAEQQQQQYL